MHTRKRWCLYNIKKIKEWPNVLELKNHHGHSLQRDYDVIIIYEYNTDGPTQRNERVSKSNKFTITMKIIIIMKSVRNFKKKKNSRANI